MDVVLFGADHADDGADPAASEPLAAIVAALEGSEEGKKQPLIRGSVRPSVFEPETCGAELGHMQRSVVVRISCSEGVVCPPMSIAIRSYLVSWLSKWLQIEDLRELGRVEIQVHTETVSRIDFEASKSD
jgi:hypothetical protein